MPRVQYWLLASQPLQGIALRSGAQATPTAGSGRWGLGIEGIRIVSRESGLIDCSFVAMASWLLLAFFRGLGVEGDGVVGSPSSSTNISLEGFRTLGVRDRGRDWLGVRERFREDGGGGGG